MSDKAMPLGRKFKVRLTITPEETGTPVDMLGFTFTSGRNGHTELDALESLAVRDAVLNAHLSKTEIASALGITRQTLYNRHKELFGELKEQCRRKPGIPSIRPHTGYATDGPYPPRRRNDGQSRNRTPVRHDHGCPPRPHDTHVAARQGPSRHPHMGAVHP